MRTLFDFFFSAEMILVTGIGLLFMASLLRIMVNHMNKEHYHPYTIANIEHWEGVTAIMGALFIIVYIVIKGTDFYINKEWR